MPNPGSFPYRDARGVLHRVVARKAAHGAWEVMDIGDRETVVIERLDGFEGAKEAIAIARDYAAHHHQPHTMEPCRPRSRA